jgi:TrmH family RNA methyltransferase
VISSRHNQKLKDMRQVRRCKGDRALLEGPHLVGEAIASGVALETVLAAPELLARPEGRELAQRLADTPGAPALEAVEGDLLAAVMDADSPRGIAAVALLPRAGAPALPRRAGGVYVYAEGLQDPGNLGALARSAEAAGAAALALSPGCAHPNHPRALRASAGSLLRLPVAVAVEADELEAHLAAAAPRWAALVPRGGESLWRADLAGTLVLALGAEGPGLSPALAARAALRLTIPLAAPVESLNATVAASLVLFETRRRREAATAAAGRC